VQVALNRNSDLMDCRERLLALYPDLDGKAFADLMGQALAVADLGAAHDRAFVMKKGDLQVTDKVKIPFPNSGVDEGWDYQPGASLAADLARLKKTKEDKLKRLGLAGDGASKDAMIDTIDDPGKGPDRGRLRIRPVGLSGLSPEQSKVLSIRELELARRIGTEKAYGVAKNGIVVVEQDGEEDQIAFDDALRQATQQIISDAEQYHWSEAKRDQERQHVIYAGAVETW